EAAEIAARTYPYILSAFGGENTAPHDSVVRHLRRWCHPNRLWDLELQLQGVLESPLPFEETSDRFSTDLPNWTSILRGSLSPRERVPRSGGWGQSCRNASACLSVAACS